jgi:16S rRNA (adenine1518-N6/adenine1519-N6)-dimethyltransferase
MTPTELRALLEPHGIRPIKGRSQHFLLDERVVVAMADAARVAEGSRVLEIGPGPGILTAELLRRGVNVVAVEIDMKLCALLRARFVTPRFTLLEGDALETSNAALADAFPSEGEGRFAPYAVVANLPYAITSATIQKFLLGVPAPTSVTVMIQKEVADRALAHAGDMSQLAVLVQTFARARRVASVAAGAFFPPPKVASAVIHMERKTDAELDAFFGGVPRERYFSLVQAAFAAPRKQLKNTLASVVPDRTALEKALISAQIPPNARPEMLAVDRWASLARALPAR